MSVLIKQEKIALRDELERTYGIRLNEDDELLPILHYINKASKLATQNIEESKNILNDMKAASGNMMEEHHTKFKILFNSSAQMLNQTAAQSKEMILTTKRELELFPRVIKEFNRTIATLEIPKQVTIKKISFEESTMSFLWKYFIVSTLAIALTVVFSFLWFINLEDNLTKASIEATEWSQLFYDKMKIEAPDATKKFVKSHPLPDFIQQKGNEK